MLRTAVLGALIRRAVSSTSWMGGSNTQAKRPYVSDRAENADKCRRNDVTTVNMSTPVDCPYQKRMAKALGAMRIATQKASDGGTCGASDLESQLLVHGRSQPEFVLGR